MFGVAFAAAAWAKLTRNPGWADWILNGSVKYHFITDAHNAPVGWPADRLATWAQLAMIVGILAQQAAFSARGIERAPMFTHYPMYSSMYASTDEFDAAMVPYYRIVVSTDRGNVELSCNAPEDLVEEFRAALQGSAEAVARVWRAVRGCGRDVGAARHVTIEGDRHVFDWERLTFRSTRAVVVIGPLAADAASAPPGSQ